MSATATTNQTLHEYRVEEFEAMGFSPEQAEKLAAGKDDDNFHIDIHFVRGLVSRSVDKDLIMRMVQPLEGWDAVTAPEEPAEEPEEENTRAYVYTEMDFRISDIADQCLLKHCEKDRYMNTIFCHDHAQKFAMGQEAGAWQPNIQGLVLFANQVAQEES